MKTRQKFLKFVRILFVLVFTAGLSHPAAASETVAGVGACEEAMPVDSPFSIEIRFDQKTEKLTKKDTKGWRMVQGDATYWRKDKVASYFRSLKESYDTPGSTIHFTTHDGKRLGIQSEYCGWKLNVDVSVQRFTQAVDSGEKEFDPAWNSGLKYCADSDVGKDYLEVSIKEQKVYLYKNGELFFETDCVTGLPTEKSQTHTGVYQLYYKSSPATLSGKDEWDNKYEQPVNYWMPFNGAEGLHDATWRNTFGGDIYLTNGSHGCVNLPLDAAEVIYKEVYTWFPVIIY